MREYKFRGRRIDTGEWVYGDIIHSAWKTFTKDCNDKYTNPRRLAENTADFRCIEVDPETIGQYTGLHDKNGKEIYEGDIYHQGDKNILYVVVWHDTSFIGKQLKSSSYAGLTYWLDRIEVIGNIHDNPELLQEVTK